MEHSAAFSTAALGQLVERTAHAGTRESFQPVHSQFGLPTFTWYGVRFFDTMNLAAGRQAWALFKLVALFVRISGTQSPSVLYTARQRQVIRGAHGHGGIFGRRLDRKRRALAFENWPKRRSPTCRNITGRIRGRMSCSKGAAARSPRALWTIYATSMPWPATAMSLSEWKYFASLCAVLDPARNILPSHSTLARVVSPIIGPERILPGDTQYRPLDLLGEPGRGADGPVRRS